LKTATHLRSGRLNKPPLFGVKFLNVKEFNAGKQTVFVASNGNMIAVTTAEHLRNENKPLKQILKEVCEEARRFANRIYSKFEYPDGEWYPCGSADVVLRWNEHREIINLFKKEGRRKGDDWWEGWFGRLFKTGSQGWWWFPKLDRASQSMRYEEEVCRFIRDKLALANIRVDVRTYID